MKLLETLLLSVLISASFICNAQQSPEKPAPGLLNDCGKNDEVGKIIGDAIELGAPLYNAGLPIACYRIYEWAGYKMLYVYGKDCKSMETVLRTAIEKSHGDYSDIEKAWIMRQAFDKIVGVATETTPLKKETPGVKG